MTPGQLSLLDTIEAPAVDLGWYDVILLNTSGGKDSQAMIDRVVELADQAGVRDRLVTVHADLGRVEWEGTRDLAERQAVEFYGLPFHVVTRPQGDLLDQVRDRGMWPSSTARYCTSDHKTGQVAKVMTALVAEFDGRALPAGGHQADRPVRILNCLGLRAEESPVRAKKPQFENEKRASNGRRHVDRWLPIHAWTEVEVWDRIRASGVPHHPAYDQGMPRLSCSFCVLASKGALVRAAQLRPDLAAEYVAVEVEIGHRFRNDLSMGDIVQIAATTPGPAPIEAWTA